MINKQEARIIAVLAGIFALRMLGLCMLLPIFAIEAQQYAQANAQLIGIAIGAYGLSQAVLQVPFGMLSDKYGRKPIIITGLGLILLGSLIAMKSTSIYGLIIGRLLQGCGAIGSVVIATMADHVREQVRASAMAILGMSIGLAFALGLVIGPWLNQWLDLSGIFSVIAILAVICGILVLTIPNSAVAMPAASNLSLWTSLRKAMNRQLFNTHFGVFVLHASLAALFLVLPALLQDAGVVPGKLWQLYLFAILVAMLVAWRLISSSERRKNVENLQFLAIISLLFAEGLLYTVNTWLSMAGSLVIFFSAFCVLEASLPALVSKYASADNRGTALGMYSCLQFLGIFIGGAVGGWVHSRFGATAVLGFCVVLTMSWMLLTVNNFRRTYAKLSEQVL